MSEKSKVHPLKRAWAAGVFDARVYATEKSLKANVLRFDSRDEALIRRFHEVVGVGEVVEDDTKMKRKVSATAGPVFIFRTVNMDDTRELILLVSPFLSPMRLKQVSTILARIERSPIWRKKYPEKAASCVTSPAPTAEAETTEHSTQADG